MGTERLSGKIFGFALAFLIFASVSIVVSYWTGFFFLSTPLILAVSLPATYLLWKKLPVKTEGIPVQVLLSALLVAGLCAFPLLVVHPFYMGSNDALHTITLRTFVLNDRIPETYAPYSDISFTYQIGFELFAKTFTDALFFVEDYQAMWFLGVLLAGIETVLMYLVSKELLGSKQAGAWAALLFIGTKTVYINFYFGMHMRILAGCLILGFLYFYKKKNKLCYLMVPALIMVHPGYFINFILLMFVYLAFNPKELKPVLKIIPAGLLAIPAFIQNYSAYVANMFFGRMASGISRAESIQLPSYTLAYALNLGWGPLVLFGSALSFSFWKKTFSKEKKFALTIFIFASAIFFISGIFNITRDNVYPWLYSLGAILFTAAWLNELKFERKRLKQVQGIVVVAMLLGFFGSSYLMTKATGSKISLEEAEFAFEFRELEPELKTVLFLGVGNAKIAELSNKTPFDVTRGWFLPFDSKILLHNEAYFEELKKAELKDELLESKCVECISGLGVEYVVINPDSAGFDLPQQHVFESNGIKVYRLP